MSSVAGLGRRPSVSAIHLEIREAILNAELAPGDELSQVQLARRFGVSRTPLREAMRMLINEGLLDEMPNRPLRVAKFSMSDIEQLYVRRIALEAVAIRITVPRLSAQNIGEMEGLLAQMAHFIGEHDLASWERPHGALHAAFTAHAGLRVTEELTQLSEYAERYRRAYSLSLCRPWGATLPEHRRIIDACKARDSDTAARELAEHLGQTALTLIALTDAAYDTHALRTTILAAGAPAPTGEDRRCLVGIDRR